MRCTRIAVPGGIGFVCSSREPRKSCSCGRASTALCDYPLTGSKAGKTCDKPLCDRCRVRIGDNVDRCPAHHALEQQAAKPVTRPGGR
jgi:hypothetical protein